jgi:hypothetical protein
LDEKGGARAPQKSLDGVEGGAVISIRARTLNRPEISAELPPSGHDHNAGKKVKNKFYI